MDLVDQVSDILVDSLAEVVDLVDLEDTEGSVDPVLRALRMPLELVVDCGARLRSYPFNVMHDISRL